MVGESGRQMAGRVITTLVSFTPMLLGETILPQPHLPKNCNEIVELIRTKSLIHPMGEDSF
jgi:hypothetical protein